MTVIKVCGLTRAEDALHAAVCGADLLGMIFVPASPRHVSVDGAAKIAQAVRANYPSGSSLLVGVFVDARRTGARRFYTVRPDWCSTTAGRPHMPPAWACRTSWQGASGAGRDLDRYKPWAYLLNSYDPARPGGSGEAWRWPTWRQPCHLAPG